MSVRWKANWEETAQHFIAWWQHRGLVVSAWGGKEAPLANTPHELVEHPGPAPDDLQRRLNIAWVARHVHHDLAQRDYPLDCLPLADTNQLGPGALSTFLGATPVFEPTTVWYQPCLHDADTAPRLRFDPDNQWWKWTEEQLRTMVQLSHGRYLVGCPDLIENIDTLAALRDSQTLLLDMLERPAWVEEKVWEINTAFFEAYQRIYDIIKLPDGSAAYCAFTLWAPGTVAKVQCDASAMFSPAMFKQFVVPALTQQCEWLDYAMFHLDGHQCLCHLDHLLAIDALDAIEWTPDPQVPSGGNPCWYDLYRRILSAGKSVQAMQVKHDEIVPLLDAVGPAGMYIMTDMSTPAAAERVARLVEPYYQQLKHA